MKYRDSDITLIKTNKIFKYNDFLPFDNFMYLKVLRNGKIIHSSGDIFRYMFRKYNSSIIHKNLNELKIELFHDYILNVINRVAEDSSAYQFTFQYKDDLLLYVCSIYPCFIYDECKSFDIIIRKNNTKRSNDSFFVSLQNTTVI